LFQNEAVRRNTRQTAGNPMIYQEKGFTVHFRLDKSNELLRVEDYEVAAAENFYAFLWDLAHQQKLGKIIFPVRPYDLYLLKNERFVMEGYLDGFFAGVPGCLLAGYLQPGRVLSSTLAEEQRILNGILTSPRTSSKTLSADIKIGPVTEKEAAVLNEITGNDLAQVTSSLKKGDLCLVARQGETVAGAIVAERNGKYQRAEITRCSVLPAYRQSNLMNILLNALAEKCRSLGIKCVYSLTRASSYDFNLTLHNSGFLFRGTLINHCSVGGRFENLHLWMLP